MLSLLKFFSIFFFLFALTKLQAQTDTLKPKGRDARTAALRAAVLPGWGQAYNKKYWKLPIVYVGAGAIGYGIYWKNANYQYFKNVYQEAYLTGNPKNINLNKAEFLRNEYRRNKEQLIIAGLIFYGLTIVDAIVDAHFSTYDVSDNLTLRWYPRIELSPQGQTIFSTALQIDFHRKNKKL